MTLELKTDFEENQISKFLDMGGILYRFKFDNNYGASIVKHNYSYGHEIDLWELGVLIFDDQRYPNGELTYETPITGDVEGCLSDEDVNDLLRQIKEL